MPSLRVQSLFIPTHKITYFLTIVTRSVMFIMWQLFILAVLASCVVQGAIPKVLCRYNSTSFLREGIVYKYVLYFINYFPLFTGLAKMTIDDLEPALPFCTHLIYDHAGIQSSSYKMISLNPIIDLDEGFGHFRKIIQLKANYPHLKILLSVGGGADHLEPNPSLKYLELLIDSTLRLTFINSAHAMVQKYGFDGIDLDWQFPQQGPVKEKTGFSALIEKIHLAFGWDGRYSQDFTDSHKYRVGFSALMEQLYIAFNLDNLTVSVTINPRTPHSRKYIKTYNLNALP